MIYLTGDFGQKQIEQSNGIELFRGQKPPFGQPFYKVLWGTFQLIRALWKINPDIIVDRTASPRIGVLILFKIIKKTPYIFMTASERDCDGSYEKTTNPLFAFLYRFGLKKASLITTQNKYQQALLSENKSISSRVFRNVFPVIPRPREEKTDILWVGRCTAVKRPELFLKMSSAIPEEKFVMIMSPALSEKELYQKTTDQAKSIQNLELIPQVPFAEIQRYYNRAKILICTSTREGFPNTFLHAAAGCTPVLSLNVDPDGILEKFRWGVNSHDNWEHFLNEAGKLLTDHNKRKAWGENAYNYFKEYHSLKKGVTLFKELIDAILD
ncbi:glycosyltransferase [Candidatus Sumerlaeota bacterium]|nr:glycosyltransferase [Candidatus Sumerlaeota bacterium]